MGHAISNLALGVGQSFLCRREGVGHVFFINHISKCSGPPPPPPILFDQSLTRRRYPFCEWRITSLAGIGKHSVVASFVGYVKTMSGCEIIHFWTAVADERFLLSNCLNWKIYCDDHSSLSLCQAVARFLQHLLGKFSGNVDTMLRSYSVKRSQHWISFLRECLNSVETILRPY